MDAFSAFDFVEIRHDCWQQCESNPNAYNDRSKLPLYRDPATEAQFQEVGKFFVCVDVCEDGYEGKRIAFIIPMVLIALFVIGVLICCCLCKCCCCARLRKDPSKGPKLLSESSSASSSSSTSTSGSATAKKVKAMDAAELIRRNWGGLYTVSAKMSSKVGDLHHRTDSSASANSWITDEDSEAVRKNTTKEDPDEKRSKLLATAQRLGKRLIEMDKKAEEIENSRKNRSRKRSLTKVETTDAKNDE